MNKACLIILLFNIVFREVDGQISLGFSGGINLPSTRFVKVNASTPSRALFYFVGITPEYHLNSKISILTDIQFSQKGYTVTYNGNGGYYRYRYTYIDLLPQIEYRIQRHISVGLGLNFGFKINEAQNYKNSEWLSTNELDLTKTFDFGLLGSIKGHFRGFNLFMRYNYGLTNISNLMFTDRDGNQISKAAQFNTNIQIGTGYTFNLKKK